MDCIFCKIIKGDIPCKEVYRDDLILAFHDIAPQAPKHVVVIPIEHIPSLMDIKDQHNEIMSRIICRIPEIVKKAKLDPQSLRLVSNCGPDGGQTVFHLHFHLLSGRKFQWPPG